MLAVERRQAMIERLGRDGRLVVSELVASLGVSEDTVRRDLRELSRSGLVHRVHGGALVPASATRSFARRLESARDEKAALAECALPLLEHARVIILDGGTTALEVALRLPASHEGTIVTTSVPTAAALTQHPKVEVLLIGGQLLKAAQVAVGASTVEAFRWIRADICVLGVCAFHPDLGVTAAECEEAEVKRAMVACSGEVIALATADKLRTASPWVVADLAEIDYLVTDGATDLTAAYTAAGIEVMSV